MQRRSAKKYSLSIAFAGIIAALSLSLMLLGGVIPIATYAVPLFCGLLLLPVWIQIDYRTGWIAFLAIALLGLFLNLDKEAAVFYLLIGCWPLIKVKADRIKSALLRRFAKVLYFNLSFVLVYVILCLVMNLAVVTQQLQTAGIWMNIALIVLYNICMVIYDMTIPRLFVLYIKKFHPVVSRTFGLKH